MFNTATGTNLLSFNPDGSKTEMKELIPAFSRLGYENLDLNFCELMNPSSSLLKNEEEYLGLLKTKRQELGLNYVQSHVPYAADHLALDAVRRTRMDDLISRAIAYSKALGIETVVIHPVIGTLKENAHYFETILKDLPSGIRLAIENLDRPSELHSLASLKALIKLLADDRVGICLDTGHLHLASDDMAVEIEKYGDKIIATHIADNHGEKDEHLMPFFGTIDWHATMRALKNAGYKGYLTYEVMFFTAHLPFPLKEKAAAMGLDILSYLSEMAN
jgi:Sugar phosphate isomerases/epimerases